MTMKIQKEEYQATYEIKNSEPDNFALAVGLCHPNGHRINIQTFWAVGNGGNLFRLDILLGQLKSVGNIALREQWEFGGILWDRVLHGHEARGRITRAHVKGEYNSRKGTGTVYVLAHEQPKPLVEVVSWEEVLCRLGTKEHIIEFKHRKNGTLKRAKLLGVGLIDDLRGAITRVDFSAPDYNWTGIGSGATSIKTEECSLPLVLDDDRIQFTANGIDYTIYLSGSGYIFTCL